ncbi:MAG: hypothetical protein P8Y85_10160 [Nitrospirota bacterium]
MCYYHIMTPGIEKAWEELRGLKPADVEKRCLVRYEGGAYVVKSLGMEFAIYPEDEKVGGVSQEAEGVVRRYGYFLNHSALLMWAISFLSSSIDFFKISSTDNC